MIFNQWTFSTIFFIITLIILCSLNFLITFQFPSSIYLFNFSIMDIISSYCYKCLETLSCLLLCFTCNWIKTFNTFYSFIIIQLILFKSIVNLYSLFIKFSCTWVNIKKGLHYNIRQLISTFFFMKKKESLFCHYLLLLNFPCSSKLYIILQ